MKSDRVVFLGSGDAFSAGGRLQAAYLFQNETDALLLDCGPGVLTALSRINISPIPINTILLTHFHGDHFAGLPFLFLYYTYVEPRTAPLRIVGPPNVEARVMQLYRAMYADSAEEKMPFDLQFIEIRPDEELLLDGRRIGCFHVPHTESSPSYGYSIQSAGKTIVFSGDSGWTEELLRHTEGADLFICECSFFESRFEMHLDYPRIAENVARFGAKRIVLTHVGQEVLRRRGEITIEIAHDGLAITP